MIPKGVILDCCCVLMGTNAGTPLRNKIPTKLQESLMVIFGMCTIAIGMVSVVKLESLSAVLLALILGTIIGELIDLDRGIKRGFLHGLHHCHFKIEENKEIYMQIYLVVAATLCVRETNIFAAAIFAMALRFGMNLIVVSQFLTLPLCFYAGKRMMSYLDPAAI